MKAPFDLVNTNVCGPFNNTFLYGVHYVFTFTNDCIKFKWVFFFKKKKWCFFFNSSNLIWGELQVCFRTHPNWRSKLGVVSSQSPGSPNRDSFGTPPWESWDKKPFGCRCHGQTQRIIYGGRWWLPPSPGHGELSESMLPVAYPNTKSDSECELTNLLVGFDAGPNN